MLANNKIGSIESDDKLIEKYWKLSKIRKLSKDQKFFKSQKLAKSKKKLSKSGNSSNINIKKAKPSFLIFKAKKTFNYL